MERAAWTDERLDDLSRHVDQGFERVSGDIRELRAEIGSLRTGVRGEIGSVRTELGAEIAALRLTLLRIGGGIMVGLVGVIAAVLAGG